jgi:hypothetical protein
MDDNQTRIYNNTTLLKALEGVDENKAIELVSDPDLDRKELSEIIQCSMMGHIVHKDTGEPMKLSNAVVMAGLRSLLLRPIEK